MLASTHLLRLAVENIRKKGLNGFSVTMTRLIVGPIDASVTNIELLMIHQQMRLLSLLL